MRRHSLRALFGTEQSAECFTVPSIVTVRLLSAYLILAHLFNFPLYDNLIYVIFTIFEKNIKQTFNMKRKNCAWAHLSLEAIKNVQI